MEKNPEKCKDDESQGQIDGKPPFLPDEEVRNLRLHPKKHQDAGQDQKQISGKNIAVGLSVG